LQKSLKGADITGAVKSRSNLLLDRNSNNRKIIFNNVSTAGFDNTLMAIILQAVSNPAVLALLEIIWLLFESQFNNEVVRNLIIPVIWPYIYNFWEFWSAIWCLRSVKDIFYSPYWCLIIEDFSNGKGRTNNLLNSLLKNGLFDRQAKLLALGNNAQINLYIIHNYTYLSQRKESLK
jgi:hypothetical protein